MEFQLGVTLQLCLREGFIRSFKFSRAILSCRSVVCCLPSSFSFTHFFRFPWCLTRFCYSSDDFLRVLVLLSPVVFYTSRISFSFLFGALVSRVHHPSHSRFPYPCTRPLYPFLVPVPFHCSFLLFLTPVPFYCSLHPSLEPPSPFESSSGPHNLLSLFSYPFFSFSFPSIFSPYFHCLLRFSCSSVFFFPVLLFSSLSHSLHFLFESSISFPLVDSFPQQFLFPDLFVHLTYPTLVFFLFLHSFSYASLSWSTLFVPIYCFLFCRLPYET